MMRLIIVSLFLYPVLGDPIMGGHVCNIHMHPWLVSIQQNNRHICGGSVISESVILTTAHCINDTAKSYVVRGRSSRTDSGGAWYRVVAKKQHEDFFEEQGSIMNDIGLIKVTPPFELIGNLRKIELVEAQKTVAPDTIVKVAGWGSELSDGGASYELKSTKLVVINSHKCSNMYGDRSGMGIIDRKQICASSNNTDACDGDSGDPLVAGKIQVGIVSAGVGCGDPKFPGIYTDVARYRTWIDTNMRKLELYSS